MTSPAEAFFLLSCLGSAHGMRGSDLTFALTVSFSSALSA